MVHYRIVRASVRFTVYSGAFCDTVLDLITVSVFFFLFSFFSQGFGALAECTSILLDFTVSPRHVHVTKADGVWFEGFALTFYASKAMLRPFCWRFGRWMAFTHFPKKKVPALSGLVHIPSIF